jgi:Bacterial TSP3 repeat
MANNPTTPTIGGSNYPNPYQNPNLAGNTGNQFNFPPNFVPPSQSENFGSPNYNPEYQNYNQNMGQNPNVKPNYDSNYSQELYPATNFVAQNNQVPNNNIPAVDNYQGYQDYGPNYQTNPYPAQDYNQNYSAPAQFANTSENPTVNPNRSSSFKEKNGGNLVFFIFAGVIIAALLSAAGWLIYYTNTQNQNVNGLGTEQFSSSVISQNNSQSEQSQSGQINSISSENSLSEQTSSLASSSLSAVSSSLSSSVISTVGTPAQKALKNNETVIPSTWLSQKFGMNAIVDGKCVNLVVCGDGADPDNDGLSNLKEYNYGADPINPDTDGDGLADGDEINVYSSDPNKKDSEGDGYDDNVELSTCYDLTIQANAKFTSTRLTEITRNAQINPLHEPTKTTLQRMGGSIIDLQNGYVQNTCIVTQNNTSASIAPSSSSSTSSTNINNNISF